MITKPGNRFFPHLLDRSLSDKSDKSDGSDGSDKSDKSDTQLSSCLQSSLHELLEEDPAVFSWSGAMKSKNLVAL